jgi:hypothetical protein
VTVSNVTSDNFCLTLRTPWRLVPNPGFSGNDSNQVTGYSTVIAYDLHDNLDQLIPQDVGWNEVVGTAQSLNGSNWATCCGAITTGPGATDPLRDFLAAPKITSSPPPSPTPTFNNPPSGTTKYREIPQTIRVGNADTIGGKGILVQTDQLTYWIDHGTHEFIIVPPKPPQ